MSQLYDACCILGFTHDGPGVIKQYPEEYTCVQRKKPFLICSFPEKNEQNIVYSFNIHRYLCFAWAFTYSGNLYSLVIISHHCFAYIFLKFLQDLREKYSTASPEERMSITIELLTKWSLNERTNVMNVFYPNYNFKATLSITDSFYMKFNPSVYLGNSTQIRKVWRTMLFNRGVLIVGDDAETVSNAVYSALSLIAPIKYTEQYLLYTKYGDMRFADIIQGETKWKVVGTTNIMAIERCKQFETIVRIDRKRKPQPRLVESLNKQVSILLKYIEHYLDKNLDRDPYSDFLQKPLTNSQIEEIAANTILNREELEDFLQTQSFIDWRKNVCCRDSFRETFLSHIPENVIANRPLSDLCEMETCMESLNSKYKGDVHLHAVISKHLKLIKKRILEINGTF